MHMDIMKAWGKRKQQGSLTKWENGHFYWGVNRVKIFLLFLTSETIDFESDHVFEIHEHLQSTANMMAVLTCFNMDQIGPNLGQIGPKQPIFKIETQDVGLLYVFENTHHYQCIHEIIWAYNSENLGQVDQNWVNCWAKFEPNWPKRVKLDPRIR